MTIAEIVKWEEEKKTNTVNINADCDKMNFVQCKRITISYIYNSIYRNEFVCAFCVCNNINY